MGPDDEEDEGEHEHTEMRVWSGAVALPESAQASLECVGGLDHGRVFTVARSGATLGRSNECDIALADRNVSRRHAQIVFEDGKFWIRDENSHHGTRLNGSPVQEHVLQPDDKLSLGATELIFRIKAF